MESVEIMAGTYTSLQNQKAVLLPNSPRFSTYNHFSQAVTKLLSGLKLASTIALSCLLELFDI